MKEQTRDIKPFVAVSWTTTRAAQSPKLVQAVEQFESLPHPGGSAATQWLKEQSLQEESQSRTYLAVIDGAIQGFYSLACGSVNIRNRDRRKKPGRRSIQPAVLITWMAKAQKSAISGEELFEHLIGVTRIRLKPHIGIQVFAVDPFDRDVRRVWEERYGFQPGEDNERLWAPVINKSTP